MDDSNDISDLVAQFRARLAANQYLIDVLAESIKDPRVKRVITLLEQVKPYEATIPAPAEEIIKICEEDPACYRGFNPRLAVLEENLLQATVCLTEIWKRIMLYLEHIQVKPGTISVDQLSVLDLAKSAVTAQKEIMTYIRQKAHIAIQMGLTKPPGPAPMPYEDQNQEREFRKLVNGEPVPIGQDYDARWDPDVRMPGTLHGKFLRFPGPYFARCPDSKGSFDMFELSGCLGTLIDNLDRHYKHVHSNFVKTGRIRHPIPGYEIEDEDFNMDENENDNDEEVDVEENEEDEEEDESSKEERIRAYEAQQFELANILAKETGEIYDHDAMVFYEWRRPQDVTATAAPYLSYDLQVAKSRLGTGLWAFEDMNRALDLHITQSRTWVPLTDVGKVAVFDRRLSRNGGQ